MKVSLISTVFNEESSIKDFLDALLGQSLKPDEIIIVDGGSIDGTVELIENYIKKNEPIKLIIEKGANISRGRNIAINHARNEIIASTDAGCKLDRDWLKNLVDKFDEDTDVVGGMTVPESKTEFERCAAEITATKIKDIDEHTYLPSSRSIAFRKTAWERAGKYPEWLYTAEDTVFDLNLKKVGCRFRMASDAIVYWKMRTTWSFLFKQYYLYGKGAKEAGLVSIKNILNNISDILSPLFLIIMLPYLPPYYFIFWIIVFYHVIRPYLIKGKKCYRLNNSFKYFIYGVVISIIEKIAWTIGHIAGKEKRQ